MRKWVLPAISIALSLSAVCIACLRSEPISVEWAAIFIGFLGALVTFLVAWQIFSAITYRKELNDTLKAYDELKKSCQETYDSLYKDVKDTFTDILPKFEEKINASISALSMVIVARQNHGEAEALGLCINILRRAEGNKGFLYDEISYAAWGTLSDIMSLKFRHNDPTQFDKCAVVIPYEDLCYLETITFNSKEVDEEKALAFRYWVRKVLESYPSMPDPTVD